MGLISGADEHHELFPLAFCKCWVNQPSAAAGLRTLDCVIQISRLQWYVRAISLAMYLYTRLEKARQSDLLFQ